jgi:hypothetical protein
MPVMALALRMVTTSAAGFGKMLLTEVPTEPIDEGTEALTQKETLFNERGWIE